MLPNTPATCSPCSPRQKFSLVNDSVDYFRVTNYYGVPCTNKVSRIAVHAGRVVHVFGFVVQSSSMFTGGMLSTSGVIVYCLLFCVVRLSHACKSLKACQQVSTALRWSLFPQEPVLDIRECAGYCETGSTHYTKSPGSCTCCQPTKTTARTVNLTCSDNSTMPYSYDVPDTCACATCAGS